MEHSISKQSRQYYRLRYPKSERPRIKAWDHQFPVTEISEKGLRFLFSSEVEIKKRMEIKGTIILSGGESFDISGEVLRVDGVELVIKLEEGPSLKQMAAEQIRIRKKFPGFFDPIKEESDSKRQTK
ncbi:PilZ domain-containing protein [Vibrio sp. S9_S30]|uniref:PilZ domain-containing protein n=1 Tax=Vibrio sp. S9_S30 TaxID=2720226 RepID=UPI0016809ABC|nr:PilZ domain-containing protein [Vibrio sp. S9_S30]MBD1557221.1 PilZ domain-containing protein [Vibrio sp. S9_S30]